jgi:hypothetical protein
LQRIKDGDFTLRGLVAELGERGLKVDYRLVWESVHAEKRSFKNKRCGWRTRPSRRLRGDGRSGQNFKIASSLSVRNGDLNKKLHIARW